MVLKCVFVMGVSGCGKTTIGELLAIELGANFEDADQYHSAENRAKMAKGIPLTDDDRYPWLLQIAKLANHFNGSLIVIACSALKKNYRKLITNDLIDDCYAFIHLQVDRKELEKRLTTRKGHFFNANLLDNQLRTLEIPADEKNCYIIDGTGNIQETLRNALAVLRPIQTLTK